MQVKKWVDDGFGPCVECGGFGRLNPQNQCRKCFGQGAGRAERG